MDPLTRALQDFGMTRVFYATSDLAGPWGIAMPPMPGSVAFHVVSDGEAVVQTTTGSHVLSPGELVLLPHGDGHLILSRPGAEATPLFDLPREEIGPRHERIRVAGTGPHTELVCGAVTFTGLAVARLLRALPDVLRLDGGDHAAQSWLLATIQLIGQESRRPGPGSDVLTSRLADVLVIQAVRSWLTQAAPDRGWVAAVRDAHLGAALAAFHDRPGEPWTLADLAREAGMSRSTFAARFTRVLGEPAMAYVTSWRMDLAARLLREGALPAGRVAERVGYQSEAAFNRAFRRAHQTTPGTMARRSRVPQAVAEVGGVSPDSSFATSA